MRLLSKILWFLAFLAATFCWMVLFEHGFSVKSFTDGVRQELKEWTGKITGAGTEEASPGGAAAAPEKAPGADSGAKAKPGA
jgi:hypothetical protein